MFTLALWLVVFFGPNPVTFTLDESDDFIARVGWYNGATLRFVPIAASDMLVARHLNNFARQADSDVVVDWTPALFSTMTKDVLGDAYFINCGQTAVFSSQPGLADYTPLWRVHWLEWKKDAVRTPLTSQPQVTAAIADGRLQYIQPVSVLDATIVVNTEGKVIPQALEYEFEEGDLAFELELPAIAVYFTQTGSPIRSVQLILLTDASDPGVAARMGANYAPRLANALGSTNPVYAFANPVPPGQYPIIDQIQSYRPWDYLQINKNYNPLKSWNLFNRGTLPPYAIIGSIKYMNLLASGGIITPIGYGPVVTNSPRSIDAYEQ